MRKKLRAVVESIVEEVLADDEQESQEEYEDLHAYCGHCAQNIYLVWDKEYPSERWTECGIKSGIRHRGETSDEPAPVTMRSPFNPHASTKVKKSI